MAIPKYKLMSSNAWYAILSVALVLVLLGFFGALLLQSNALMTNLKENINIILELKDERTEADIVDIKEKLAQSEFAKPNSIRFISKDDALNQLREEFGEDFMQLDMINPLHDVYIFNVKAEYLEDKMLEIIRTKIMDNIHVRDVYYQENMVDLIGQNLSKIAWTGVLIGVFFLLVAIFLIHNTMRLALHSNRFLIKNMELVGASWNFISRPFLWKSIQQGLMSGLIAIVILYLLLSWLMQQLPNISLFEGGHPYWILGIGIVLLGVLISVLSTYSVVHKYLKMRLDDLY